VLPTFGDLELREKVESFEVLLQGWPSLIHIMAHLKPLDGCHNIQEYGVKDETSRQPSR
jgi:hypothetical protein